MGNGGLSVSEARGAEHREQAYRLWYEIFVEEFGITLSIADHERRLVSAPDEDSPILLLADEGVPVGALIMARADAEIVPSSIWPDLGIDRFVPTVPAAEIGVVDLLAVKPEYRKTEAWLLLGEGLMVHHGDGIGLWVLVCEPHMVPTYHYLGFRASAPPFNTDASRRLMLRMALNISDHEHLRRVGSPAMAAMEQHGSTGDPAKAAAVNAVLDAVEPCLWTPFADPAGYRAEVAQHLRAAPTGVARLAEAVIDTTFVMAVPPGVHLTAAGQNQTTVYVVLDGHAEVLEEGDVVDTSGPGHLVGEAAFLLDAPRMADVAAGADGLKVLGISVSVLTAAAQDDADLGRDWYRGVATELALKLTARQAQTSV